MSDEVESLISYFEGFRFKKDGKEEKTNFSTLKEILSEEGKMKVGEDIILDGLVIPNIGPSEGLLKFHLLLKKEDGWEEDEIEQVEKMCNIHYGNLFSDDEECLNTISILRSTKTFSGNKNLDGIKSYLEGKSELIMDDVYGLSSKNDLFASGIARYVLQRSL